MNTSLRGLSSALAAIVLIACSSIPAAGQSTGAASSFGTSTPSATTAVGPDRAPQLGTVNPTVAQTTSMEVLNDTVKLGIGDRVSFRVVEEWKEPITLLISDSGDMETPLIGRVKAVGKTCKELAYTIKPMLEKEYYYKASVIIGLDSISTKALGKVYITGQVRMQGAIELMPDETLTISRAVLRAGGLADFANRRKVKLVRKAEDGSTKTQFVDLVEILDRGRLEKDPVLQPGDLINVPERLINF